MKKEGERMRLSDTIERFIKEMMAQDQLEVELQRNELAEYFRCSPSQINYVLSTRFTPDHGYVIESRRGGGGFIRITRLQRKNGDYLEYLLKERIGNAIDVKSAQILSHQLSESRVISQNDARLINAALSPQAFSVPIPIQLKDALRASVLRHMLLSIAMRNGEEDHL